MLDYGTTAGEGLDCYTADGEDDRDNGSPSDRSRSYVTRDGVMTSHGVRVLLRRCRGQSGGAESPEIVEMMTRRHRWGEYGGTNWDPGGSASRRRRA